MKQSSPPKPGKTTESKTTGLVPPGDYWEFQLTVDDIVTEAKEFIAKRLGDLIPSAIEPLTFEVYGSRTKGVSRWGSDLDLKLFYRGRLREDAAFNILNEEPLFVYGLYEGQIVRLRVDINPIKR